MSIYFQTKPACVQDSTIPVRGTASAHPIEPLFAFGCTPGGRVVVCNDEGDTVHEIPGAAAAPTTIAWHPTRAIFAVGYRNGGFLINGVEGTAASSVELKEQPQLHQGAAITAASFGGSGESAGGIVATTAAAAAAPSSSSSSSNTNNKSQSNALLGPSPSMTVAAAASSSSASSSADAIYFATSEKVVSVWSITGDNTLTPLWNTKAPSAITTITRGRGFLFMHAATSENILVIDEAQQNASVGVALNTKEVGNPVRSVWEPTNRVLLVLTSNTHLLAFKTGFDGKMNQISQKKLTASVVSDSSLLQLVLVTPSIVAIAAGDATIRVIAWQQQDQQQESNATSATAAAADGGGGGGRATSLYFPDSSTSSTASSSQQVVVSLSSARQRLCAGNRAGHVAVWQFLGSAASLDEWQLLSQSGPPSSAATASASSQKKQQKGSMMLDNFAAERVVLSHSSNGSVLVCGQEYITLLQGTVRQRKWHSKAMALQVSPSKVSVQNTSGVSFSFASAESRVRGIDIFWPNVLLWTGKSAEVFSLVEATSSATLVATFEQTLPACALYADGVLLTRPDKVMMMTFSKHNNHSLALSDAEGAPQVLHVAEEIGAMVTNKGSLKVFKIGARDLKAVGPSRQLRTPQGQPVTNVGLMVINRSGKKVAFTCLPTSSSSSSSASSGALQQQASSPQFSSSGVFFGGDSKQQEQVAAVTSSYDLSTSVFVHDVDTDSCFEFSFLDKSPTFLAWNMAYATAAGGVGTLNAQHGGPDAEAMLLAVETRIVKSHHHGHHHQQQNNSRAITNNNDDGKENNTATTPILTPQQQQHQQQHHIVDASLTSGQLGGGTDRHVTTLFASPKGVFHHHTIPLLTEQSGLIGCSVPHLVLGIQLEAEDFAVTGNFEHSLFLKHLRDFDGMAQQADTDAKLREALMHFAYYAAIGSMDEAYKAVKTVKDPAIWVNMARMCVSTKRIDVAEVCLSNMQDTVAARMVRESRDEALEVRLATLAMALGMVDEAEALLRKAKRYDQLTELYIATGRWEQAVTNCEQHDRLRTTSVFFRQAQQAESAGLFDTALQLFGRAKCLGTESPRLLFNANRVGELQEKVRTTDDRDLLAYWAQYLESSGDAKGALECYKRARDGFNAVRLLVSQKKIEEAEELLNMGSTTTTSSTTTSSTPSSSVTAVPSGAAFFIARHYESQNNIVKAVQMFERASAFENAIRLGKEHDMHVDVLRISLKCGNAHTALESGRYFEERNMHDRAVQLYRHAGDNQRAIDVCIKGGLFDELHKISESLEQGADPETFIQMASHFSNNGHYSKAVEMLVFGKAFNEALQLCLDKNVKLTDAMAEAMTLPKSDNAEDEEYRLNLLKKIAKVAKDQESYHLACKKYTQCGEVMKAMRALLKSGDTEKIIFFANHIRDQEVYYNTANFLQSTNWQVDQSIFKSIVNFYTRSKSYESLALFYDTASQMQIDENRSYEKAAGYLREGMKAFEKGGDTIDPRKRDNLARRIDAVDALLKAQALTKQGKNGEFVGICNDLLERARPPHPDSELIRTAIRLGDVYALLAEFYANSNQNELAFKVLEQMHGDGIPHNLFVEPSLMQRILKAAGADEHVFESAQDKRRRMSGGQHQKPQQDDIAEEVDEDI